MAEALIEGVAQFGVSFAFGLVGGAGVPIYDALMRSPIRVVHFRNETGAVYAAVEANLATGAIPLVFTTTGPGLHHTLPGLAAARREGAKVLVVSAATSPAQRGRAAFQETGLHTECGADFLRPGSLFDEACNLEHIDELGPLLHRLRRGFSRPGRFVAHVAVPTSLQTTTLAMPGSMGPLRLGPSVVDRQTVLECAELLRSRSTALLVGFGARDAAPEVRQLAARTGAVVISTPRGKGTFAESHPQYIGSLGLGGSAHARRAVQDDPPAVLMALGTRMGEFSTFWNPQLAPSEALIHVDHDPAAFGPSYGEATRLEIQADIATFLRQLLVEIDESTGPLRPVGPPPWPYLDPGAKGPVDPRAFFTVIQREVVEATNAWIMSEAGAAFAWATDTLRFDEPGRYRTSTSYGSMGHASAGVVGAALATGDKAVAVVGDGAFLLLNEVHTAVATGADAVWLVLNDAGFGIVDHGIRLLGYTGAELRTPPANFASIGRALGAVGIRVEREDELVPAMQRAMQVRGPCVVDVLIDPAVPPPVGQRVATLEEGR